ncbi:MAG TPA: NUDIX domain-containing protein [Limnochordia bacterium]
MQPDPKRRHAARAALLTPAGQLLLMQAEEPLSGRRIWFTPGGGREPGEDDEACLRRELAEETGLRDFVLGPPIWVRDVVFTWGGEWLSQRETIYLIRTDRFDPDMRRNPAAGEVASFRAFRWWTAAEIAASTEQFVPGRLGEYLRDLVTYGPPPAPIDVGR